MNITLYQAQRDLQNKIMLAANEDGEIDMEKVRAIEATFEAKAVAYVAVHKTIANTLGGLVQQRYAIVAEYDKAIERAEKNQQRIKDALKTAMRETGTKKVASDDGLLLATLSVDATEAVEIEDESLIGAEWRKQPKAQADMPIDRTALKEAIKAGQPVPRGVALKRGDRLTIK